MPVNVTEILVDVDDVAVVPLVVTVVALPVAVDVAWVTTGVVAEPGTLEQHLSTR